MTQLNLDLQVDKYCLASIVFSVTMLAGIYVENKSNKGVGLFLPK